MFQISLKTAFMSLLAAALLAGFSFLPQAQAADTALTREAVEKIVHDYIMEHPDVILTAVDQYQQKTQEERQNAALESNRDVLFNDERSPFIGNEKGDVVMIEFFDYNCGYCKKVLPSVQALVEEDKNLKVIFKDLPILGPTSEIAAKWALAAQKQQKYFPFHLAMMEHQGPINDDVLVKAAKAADLDIDRVRKDIDTTDVLLQVERNRSLASQMGLGGTPAFIINDIVVPGAISKDDMKAKIEEARSKVSGKKPEKKEDKKAE